MRVQIQTQLEHQQQLFRAISHELRTPLARMRFRLGIMEEEEYDGEPSEHTKALDNDLLHIDSLVDELLTHARLESGAELRTEELLLEDELSSIIAERQAEALSRQIDLDIDPSATLVANRRLFRRAIGNLVSNAIRHGQGRISIKGSRDSDELHIDVSDEGPGVAKNDRERIFRPFERATDDNSGSGLGLAIVRSIVNAHGGSITANGSCFRSTWLLSGECSAEHTEG